MWQEFYDDPDYLDCHYYEPIEEDFMGCPGPHDYAVECEKCPYGKSKIEMEGR